MNLQIGSLVARRLDQKPYERRASCHHSPCLERPSSQMPSAPKSSVALSAQTASQALSPEQKRFAKLTQQIDQARDKLAAWHSNLPPFFSAMREQSLPLAESLKQLHTAWVHELERLLGQKGWTKRERAVMQELLCEGAWNLLEGMDDPDPAIQAIFDKYAETPFADLQAQDHQNFIDMVERVSGIDLGDDAHELSEKELFARARQGMDELEDAMPPPAAKPTKAQAKKQAEAELTAQSLRDIYRKLASALHPDREPDPDKRATRTALMQKANQAYEQKDLLTLLSLQLETAQINSNDLAATAPAKLKLYNKALAEQLADIQAQIKHIEYGLRLDFELPPNMGLDPNKLVKVLDRQIKQLKQAQANFQLELFAFEDKQDTKRWLRMEMERLEMEAMSGDWY